MQILQLCNKIPYPPIDGGAIASLNMTKGFAGLGNKVMVLSMNTGKHYFDISLLPKDIKLKAEFVSVDVKASISFAGAFINLLFSCKPYNAERFIDNKFRRKLIEVLENKKFDIVQLEGLYLAPYIKDIRMFSKAKIVMRAHNVEHEIWERVAQQSDSKIKKIYLNILYRRLKRFEIKYINKYDLLVPISQRDLDIFNKLGNKKPAFVSQTGIDITGIKADFDMMEFPSLFHIGALDWAPNQEGLKWFFDNVWKKVTEKYPALKFYVAGRNAPQNIVSYFNKIHNVEYLGEVDNAHEFMNSKSVMIVPLLSGSGMRIKIIEGMALGKAIISTSIGTEGINSSHKENIFIANTVHEFLSAIDDLVNNKELVLKTGASALKFVAENFDNKSIISQLMRFYSENIT